MSAFGTATALRRHAASFVRCVRCGSVQVVDPVWLDEAYASPIAEADIGLPSRAVDNAMRMSALIRSLGVGDGRFLDYAGGNGLFVRLMRDRGFDFLWQDVFADNQFAKGCVGDLGSHFQIITAFEVVEHLVDPVALVKMLAAQSDVIVLSTTLLPEPAPEPGSWPYYALETGQHITFFSRAAVSELAARVGLHLSSRGALHILSHRKLPRWRTEFALRSRVAASLSELTRQQSLLAADVARLHL